MLPPRLPHLRQHDPDDQVNWVEQLYADAEREKQEFDLYTTMDETNEFLRIEFNLAPPSSNRHT